MRHASLSLLLIAALFSCAKKTVDAPPVADPAIRPPATASVTEPYYFPPVTGNTWSTKTAFSIGWNTIKLIEAFNYAGSTNATGMIVLHRGKIVREQYWGTWNSSTTGPIFSAGKSVLALLMGIARQEGLVNINNKTSQYLGTGWTSAPLAKENLIQVKNNLAMTTGLDDGGLADLCVLPACLTYKADAGTRWAYHTGPYRLLQDVIENVSGQTINQYSQTKLWNRIGMKNSTWNDYVMYGTTRDMARFGSLMLNRGVWNGTNIMTDTAYFNAMVSTSQPFNLSYGYLWWLNGKSSYMLPGLQTVFNGSLVPDAPADMYMALGKDDKKIYVVPSLDVVVVRLGDAATGSAAGPSSFDNILWGKLKLAMNY